MSARSGGVLFWIIGLAIILGLLRPAPAEAVTYYLMGNTSTNLGADGTANLPTAQSTGTTIPYRGIMQTTSGTGISWRPSTIALGTKIMIKGYGPVYAANAVDISGISLTCGVRSANTGYAWRFYLYDYNPAGAAGNKALVATSSPVSVTTAGTTEGVTPASWTISGTGRVQQNHRLMMEVEHTSTASSTGERVYYQGTTATAGCNLTVTETTVATDTTPPTVTINQAGGQADPTGTSPINFAVVFSETVTGFATGDVTITGTAGGTKTATVSGSGTTYNVAVTGMTTAGTVIATIGAGVATDGAGNGNTASTSTDNTVTWSPDTTPPTVTINQSGGQADPTGASPINFAVVFSETVTGFATGDVTITGTAGGTKTATVTGSGTTYNVAVTGMTTAGTVIATIGAGVAIDGAGNGNTASTSTDNTVTWDNVAPTVTINQAGGQADPTGTSPINFAVVFSETVTGFATGDVTITGTAGGTKTATVTGSGTTYNVAVTGMTTAGTVIATIGAGVATDGAGNGNAASTSTDNTVTWSGGASPPNPPTGISHSNMKTGGPTITWNTVVGATSYNVYRSTDGSTWNTTIGGGTALSYTDTAAPKHNTVYYWTVTAVNANGESTKPAGVSGRTALYPGYSQISAPYNLTGVSPISAFGSWANWAWKWDSASNVDPDNSGTWNTPTEVTPGKGMFIWSYNDATVLNASGPANAAPLVVTLVPGWNTISNPLTTNMTNMLANWRIDGSTTLTNAITGNIIDGALLWWDGNQNTTFLISGNPTIEPWKSYYILNLTGVNHTLTIQ